MTDCILAEGDQVLFEPLFTPAMVIILPGVLMASNSVTLNSRRICVVDDIQQVQVPGCPYTSSAFSIPGVGILTIEELAQDQQGHVKVNSQQVLLEGMEFQAKFQVLTPAQIPPPAGGTDPISDYEGKGRFLNSNFTVKSD